MRSPGRCALVRDREPEPVASVPEAQRPWRTPDSRAWPSRLELMQLALKATTSVDDRNVSGSSSLHP
jgi:hypothetical protein